LAISSGISASPGVSKLRPVMVAEKLTKQYGDQLSRKAEIVAVVINAIFCLYLLRRAWMKGSPATGGRLSNLANYKCSKD